MENVLYKYRSLQNFDNFLDVLLCNRLYGANYDKLNDPMECSFREMDLSEEKMQELRDERRKLRICSLSQAENNNLLWSHYADGHRGVCIALKVRKTDLWEYVEVKYVDSMPTISTEMPVNEILQNRYGIKANFWNYEKEIRYVKKAESKQNSYLPVFPIAVYMGTQISSKHKTLIKHIVKLLNTTRKEKIELIEMKYNNMDFFHNNN